MRKTGSKFCKAIAQSFDLFFLHQSKSVSFTLKTALKKACIPP